MSDKYKILIDKEDIKIFKKQNKIKIEIKTELNNSSDFLKIFESYEFFNMLKILNPDIIEKSKIKNDGVTNNVILIINNIDNNNDFEYDSKSYISFCIDTQEKTDNSIKLKGRKNSIKIEKEHYEKLEIDEIVINVSLTGNKLFLEIKIKYLYNMIPVYTENILGFLLCKIFKKLINHYKK